jgi:hypothetical protein
MVVFVDREWWSTITRDVWRYHKQTSPRGVDAVTEQHTKEERLHKWASTGAVPYLLRMSTSPSHPIATSSMSSSSFFLLPQLHRHEFVLHSSQVD